MDKVVFTERDKTVESSFAYCHEKSKPYICA